VLLLDQTAGEILYLWTRCVVTLDNHHDERTYSSLGDGALPFRVTALSAFNRSLHATDGFDG